MASTPAYSFSRITTFEQCARRFRYRYLDRVKEAFDSVEAFMGRQVHSTIEWMYGERLHGETPTATAAVERYCDTWDREFGAAVRRVRVIKSGTDLESYRRTGAEILARFHRDRFVSDRLETVANEKHFLVPIDGRYHFQGYIDRLARDESGRLHVIDYKTGKRAPQRFEGKEAEQLEAYALGIFADPAVEKIELVLEFLRPGTTLARTISRAEIGSLEQKLAGRIMIVEEATVFPTNPGALCDWCGYNDLCEGYGAAKRRRIGKASA